jgi:hypothetical protein
VTQKADPSEDRREGEDLTFHTSPKLGAGDPCRLGESFEVLAEVDGGRKRQRKWSIREKRTDEVRLSRESEEVNGVDGCKSSGQGKIAEKELLPGGKQTFEGALGRGEDGNAGIEPAGDRQGGLVREEREEQLRLGSMRRRCGEVRIERRGVGETQPREQAGEGMVGRVEAG